MVSASGKGIRERSIGTHYEGSNEGKAIRAIRKGELKGQVWTALVTVGNRLLSYKATQN